MKQLKSVIKQLFFAVGLSSLFDKLIYQFHYFKNKNKNRNYANICPSIVFPPNYYLYETYKLDYKEYFEDGDLSAKEIIEWTKKYLLINEKINILEWGCGVARTTRHLHKYTLPNTSIYACDINNQMIEWNKKNIANISFDLINYQPPTSYTNKQFHLIFAISVLTHIEATKQENWLQEICRILTQDGIFLFTTHGKKFIAKLSLKEKNILKNEGIVTTNYFQKGHRLMSTYNDANSFKNIIEKYFEILEYYDGEEHIEKMGGQDLWIVRRK